MFIFNFDHENGVDTQRSDVLVSINNDEYVYYIYF